MIDLFRDLACRSGRFLRGGACCLKLTVYTNLHENELPEDALARAEKKWSAIVKAFGPTVAGDSECASATLVTWVPCGLSFIRVETCCDGLSPEECAAAHQAAVEEIEEICEGM